MADKSTEWKNFTSSDLPEEARKLHKAIVDARNAFERHMNTVAPEGFEFRFSYKGEAFERMGMCKVKRSAANSQSLKDWMRG